MRGVNCLVAPLSAILGLSMKECAMKCRWFTLLCVLGSIACAETSIDAQVPYRDVFQSLDSYTVDIYVPDTRVVDITSGDTSGAVDASVDIDEDIDTCPEGTSYCDQDFLVTCTAVGAEVTKCESGCVDGACNALQPVCVPGSIVCQSVTKKLLECSPDGLTASTFKVCPYGCAEGASECSDPACDPGETRCAADDSKFVELCAADQSGFVKAELACKDICKDGKCIVPACVSGTTQCGVLGIEICSQSQDAYESLELCKSGCLLTASGPTCAKCSVGQIQCKGLVVETCNDPLVGFEESFACAEFETCVNGACLSVVKLSGDVLPTENYRLLTKAFASCFAAENEGFCSSIDTSDVDYDITPGEIAAWFCDNKGNTPGFEQEFASDIWLAAIDVMGCGFFNYEDMTFEGGVIASGGSGIQCIAYDPGGLFTLNKKEIVVDACEELGAIVQ